VSGKSFFQLSGCPQYARAVPFGQVQFVEVPSPKPAWHILSMLLYQFTFLSPVEGPFSQIERAVLLSFCCAHGLECFVGY
jgi:hypothetical protein